MPPEQFTTQGKDKKMQIVVTVAAICALVLGVAAFYLFSSQERPTPVTPGDQTAPEATTTVKVDTSVNKVPVPQSFSGDTSMQGKRETLLALALKSKTQTLSTQEKAYILQEFGGERTALYKFTNDELKLILDALNH